jgi:anti-sigma B factor antagonist
MASSTERRPARPSAATPPPTTVAVSTVGRRTVLEAAGEIDIATAPLLAGAVDEAIAAGAAEVALDLTDVTFMDSTGLHLLCDAHQRLGLLGRRLTVICPPGGARRLLELTGLDAVFELSPAPRSARRGS